ESYKKLGEIADSYDLGMKGPKGAVCLKDKNGKKVASIQLNGICITSPQEYKRADDLLLDIGAYVFKASQEIRHQPVWGPPYWQ
ncbi:MAG: hypothetical protein JSV92_00475, partial [archaeon]